MNNELDRTGHQTVPERTARVRQSLVDTLHRPVDAASLVIFRIAFGALMIWEMRRYFAHGWIDRYYIAPDFNFAYWGFEWVKPWPGIGMYLHFAVMGMFAAFIMCGFLYRASAFGFFLSFTYVFLLDQTQYLNHFYLISLISFLMILVPANRSFSLDAVMWPRIRSAVVPVWSVWILRFMVGVPFFFGGIAKLNADWLCGQPLSMWIHNDTGYPLIGQYFTEKWMGLLLSYGGLIFDLCIVPLLLWKRTRVLAYSMVIVFNVMNSELFSIGVFPWFMIAGSTIFFDPGWPRRVLRWLRVRTKAPAMDAATFGSHRSRCLVTSFVVVFVAVQVALPFRHLLYPGNVNWTEEGHRFSWHMKLRSKRAKSKFVVKDPRTNREWKVNPYDFLTRKQKNKMEARPYLILSFAHYLESVYREKGYEDVEVYAQVRAGLNGRKKQPYIDQTVDLTTERHSFLPKKWVLPLTEPLR